MVIDKTIESGRGWDEGKEDYQLNSRKAKHYTNTFTGYYFNVY